jgi:uncharacterized protein (DUF2164 family)
MKPELLNEALEIAISNFEFDGEHEKAQEIRDYITDEARELNRDAAVNLLTAQAYNQGVQDALEELSSIFEGIEDTDLWAQVFK